MWNERTILAIINKTKLFDGMDFFQYVNYHLLIIWTKVLTSEFEAII